MRSQEKKESASSGPGMGGMPGMYYPFEPTTPRLRGQGRLLLSLSAEVLTKAGDVNKKGLPKLGTLFYLPIS